MPYPASTNVKVKTQKIYIKVDIIAYKNSRKYVVSQSIYKNDETLTF